MFPRPALSVRKPGGIGESVRPAVSLRRVGGMAESMSEFHSRRRMDEEEISDDDDDTGQDCGSGKGDGSRLRASLVLGPIRTSQAQKNGGHGGKPGNGPDALSRLDAYAFKPTNGKSVCRSTSVGGPGVGRKRERSGGSDSEGEGRGGVMRRKREKVATDSDREGGGGMSSGKLLQRGGGGGIACHSSQRIGSNRPGGGDFEERGKDNGGHLGSGGGNGRKMKSGSSTNGGAARSEGRVEDREAAGGCDRQVAKLGSGHVTHQSRVEGRSGASGAAVLLDEARREDAEADDWREEDMDRGMEVWGRGGGGRSGGGGRRYGVEQQGRAAHQLDSRRSATRGMTTAGHVEDEERVEEDEELPESRGKQSRVLRRVRVIIDSDEEEEGHQGNRAQEPVVGVVKDRRRGTAETNKKQVIGRGKGGGDSSSDDEALARALQEEEERSGKERDMNLKTDERIARELQEEEDVTVGSRRRLRTRAEMEVDGSKSRRVVRNMDGNDEAEDDKRDDGVIAERDVSAKKAVDDPVSAALWRCESIAASLRNQLRTLSSSSDTVADDVFSEVDDSAVKLVTQDDIAKVCSRGGESRSPLKPYQLVGVNFLVLLHRQNVGGAILADEMGLGKTVQAITFLGLLKHLENDPGPHLVVVPVSLLENWYRELNMWCPSLEVVFYYGDQKTQLKSELQSVAKSGRPAPFNVLLTSYTIFERDSPVQKEDRQFLRRWNWSCVVMDEAHLLKDRLSARTRRLRMIAATAKRRLMLTGTPLQNDLQELWALLEFLLPDVFKDVDLNAYAAQQLKLSGKEGSDEDNKLAARMKAMLGPFVLRRVKADVMRQLVPKTKRVEFVTMVPQQKQAYEAALDTWRNSVKAKMAAKNGESAVSSGALSGVLTGRQILNIFSHLRKIANHPLLVRRLFSDEDVKFMAQILHRKQAFGDTCSLERVVEELMSENDYELHVLCKSHFELASKKLPRNAALQSGKCQMLAGLLSELKEKGSRPLIFSQFTAMLDILEWALFALQLSYVRLDGSTQTADRQRLVDEFNNDTSIFCFILSTRAGGQGLNLTGADTVILHDMDFNPEVDKQAEDRCHRIGQTKPVTVYRLVTKGTVDENILRIGQRKLAFNEQMLDSGGGGGGADLVNTRTMSEILAAALAERPSHD
ncbi:hypothetical protein CBR_g22264 [Chara braunii]|uniref:Uncharacterized protein n=1 Tax=Chara braunii TaxID=69332 RepID=A0A388L2K3_CHABU|nr:hypothetical protein CBR_g22264 [Chara braunii]|eukprot:GBG76516.1 hypothetical protein CBR_g22264 [Chara braunii]